MTNDIEAPHPQDTAGPSAEAVDIESTEADRPGTEPLKVDSPGASDGKQANGGKRSISVGVRELAVAGVIVILVVAVAVLAWLYIDVRSARDAQVDQMRDDARAEQVALDYAVNAATMDYKDLQAWHVKLVAGTSPELSKKLSDAGTSMEQVLVPLQWSSVAQPLVAKVRTNTDGRYVVDSFVSVQTKTVQAPEPLQSTATYSTTIDSNNDWQITDVGGIGSAMAPK